MSKRLSKNFDTIGNCFQAFYKNVEHLQGLALYRQCMKESRDSKRNNQRAYSPRLRTPYVLPDLDSVYGIAKHTSWATVDTTADAAAIGKVLSASGIDYRIEKITQGPTITLFTLSLADFRDYEKAMKLEKSFRAALDKEGIRVTQSGANLNIEVPCFVDTLRIGDILADDKYRNGRGLTVGIGRAIDGQNVIANIEDLKHVLVAGASGSGKSVFVQGLLISLLAKHTPDELELYMVDPKMVEFSFYKNLVQCHVVTEMSDAVGLLNHLTEEMDNRYRVLANAGVRDIDSFNERGGRMKRIVVFIDELADLIETSRKAVEGSIVRIAQKARACGIHLVIATQYPVARVVTGLIKSNMPTKVCFAVTSATASCVMLGRGGAEKLIGKGDMLYQTEKDISPIRLQGGFASEVDINNVVYALMDNQVA